jgi:hypothetical protein
MKLGRVVARVEQIIPKDRARAIEVNDLALLEIHIGGQLNRSRRNLSNCCSIGNYGCAVRADNCPGHRSNLDTGCIGEVQYITIARITSDSDRKAEICKMIPILVSSQRDRISIDKGDIALLVCILETKEEPLWTTCSSKGLLTPSSSASRFLGP